MSLDRNTLLCLDSFTRLVCVPEGDSETVLRNVGPSVSSMTWRPEELHLEERVPADFLLQVSNNLVLEVVYRCKSDMNVFSGPTE